MLRHRAGEPVGGVQRCTWCKLVLVEWVEELQPRLSTKDVRAMFFPADRDVIESHGGSTFRTATESDERVICCVPDVEAVDVR